MESLCVELQCRALHYVECRSRPKERYRSKRERKSLCSFQIWGSRKHMLEWIRKIKLQWLDINAILEQLLKMEGISVNQQERQSLWAGRYNHRGKTVPHKIFSLLPSWKSFFCFPGLDGECHIFIEITWNCKISKQLGFVSICSYSEIHPFFQKGLVAFSFIRKHCI